MGKSLKKVAEGVCNPKRGKKMLPKRCASKNGAGKCPERRIFLLSFPFCPHMVHCLNPIEEAGEGGDFNEMKLVGDLGGELASRDNRKGVAR